MSRKYAPPFATLALLQTAGGEGGGGDLYTGCDIFSRDYALLVLALPFHHGDLEPDCRGLDEGGLMCGIKVLLQDFALKMQGGLMREGGREGGRICGTLRYM